MHGRTRLALSAAGVALATMTPLTLTVVGGTTASLAATSGAAAGARLTLHSLGTAHFAPTSPASGEFRPAEGDDAAATDKAVANRSPHSHAKSLRGVPPPSGVSGTSLGVNSPGDTGWQGINHRDQRLADGGNQWSTTPPDQGLCASSSWVMEMVNVAFAVYQPNGTQDAAGVQAINPFFGFSHEVVRNSDGTLTASPHQVGDPSCIYDQGSGRFFLTVLDLISDTNGNPTGPTQLDIAVSKTSDPTGDWWTYQLDTTDDGTDQTPSHTGCPCFPDYPHIGTDANGFYITSNEFPVFGDGYDGANLYAMSKAQLTNGVLNAPVQQWNTARADDGLDGFTLAPALAADGNYATANNGTMYFLSSNAASQPTGTSSTNILQWSLTNTASLDTTPNLSLSHARIAVPLYAIPPAANQKTGSVPLADCLNLTACSKLVLGTPDKYKEYEYALESSLDSGMFQSAFANGKLWGSLGTAVDVGGVTKAGVAYYIVDPTTQTLSATHTLVVPGNNLTYPALGVTTAGKAVMAVSLMGADYYPSAAYITMDDTGTAPSTVTVVGAGLGPDDEFGGYRGFLYNRARWGDYGAASVVDSTVWIASEYIAQTCTLSQYMTNTAASPFGSCNKTRTSLANWSTHITSVTP